MNDIWTCPRCGHLFLAVFTDEDLEDGCKDGVTMCYACFEKEVLENFDISRLIQLN